MKKHIALFCNPLYWPAWLGLGLLWLITRLRYHTQLSIGRGLGLFIHLFPSSLKRTTETNIARCFPELTTKERQTLVKKNFVSIGMGVIETGMAWWMSNDIIRHLYTIHGEEHLTRALEKGKGVLFLSPHFSCLELAGRLFGLHSPFAVIYRPHKKSLMAFIHEQFRAQHYNRYIPRHDVRQILKALEESLPIWYAYDIDGGYRHSVFAPFFGIQASSMTAAARIAQLSGATILPICFSRREDGLGYDLTVFPPLDTVPTDDPIHDASVLNLALENSIRLHPDQYIWQYKRFKTRPPGEPSFYEK